MFRHDLLTFCIESIDQNAIYEKYDELVKVWMKDYNMRIHNSYNQCSLNQIFKDCRR